MKCIGNFDLNVKIRKKRKSLNKVTDYKSCIQALAKINSNILLNSTNQVITSSTGKETNLNNQRHNKASLI